MCTCIANLEKNLKTISPATANSIIVKNAKMEAFVATFLRWRNDSAAVIDINTGIMPRGLMIEK